WNWNESSIETHAAILEAFSEVSDDTTTISEIKAWLLINKKANDWGSTIATTNAIAAILLNGSGLFQSEPATVISLGGTYVDPMTDASLKLEAGTGYFAKTFSPEEIKPAMKNIQVIKADEGPGFGAVYYQYFEDIDKIERSTTSPLTIER